ncbi:MULTISPECIES: hypothetical protein [Staphylococcus]|uniref:Uncharacterized protein n=1 Tax=Staphylococcus agnetis TaxID=985762 RepID=A0ABX3Z1S8_9STAP|nr:MULTISPECIES: hypothetical protein [Staphylococcus]ALN77498.1 hypothetical protein EP23_09115 [Staphylococcus agnetis]EZU79051.1 hypothetical protein U995_02592 [Staphylococcus aureus 1111203374]MDG4943473.1 hypothetical protein [Staphylococcus agnetis]OSP14898.1 hypothetical protein B9L42_11685 [Staphylococcus agnetis]OSP22706.1 hypothetical protein B9M87_11295 [Staphylococcus agnetis]
MEIYFDECETFHFLTKKDMRRDLGVYIYVLASESLGQTVIVHSKKEYNFDYLAPVKLKGVSLYDFEVTLYSEELL